MNVGRWKSAVTAILIPFSMTISGRLGYEFELTSDENSIKEELYKEEHETFAYTDTGKILLEGKMDEFSR